MNKNAFTTVKLAKGEMNVYDFGGIKLHAYKTNELDQRSRYLRWRRMEKPFSIESPCFFDNIGELADYLKNLKIEGMLVAYMAPAGPFCRKSQSMPRRTP